MLRCAVITLALSFATTNAHADSIVLLPKQITLTGTEASQRLLVHRRVNNELHAQVPTNDVTLTSTNPDVVTVRNGIAYPVKNGRATITAKVGNHTTSAVVNVLEQTRKHEWSFRKDVLPILAKSGCNAGSCHGALAGKGGFKLSLRGYDPETDYYVITKQARGRRIELSDPGRSLFLAKPSGALPHKGGIRFDVDSREYQILSEWISAGAKSPAKTDAKVERVEVLPEQVTLSKGAKQQVCVRAHFSDGHTEDVTQWAMFTSTNEAVLTINQQGEVNVIGHGEGAITAWYASKIDIGRMTVPYPNNIAKSTFDKAPQRNFIDNLVLAKLQQLNLPPSPRCDDSTFIRRAFLDTIGTLPTAEETEAFLKDKSPDKRDKLIDQLLARPEFVDYWTYKWSDLLLINGTQLRPKAVEAYYKWIRGHVQTNTPWDKLVHELVTSTGSSYVNGATNFFALHQDPETMAENVSQAFMGLSIACAKCHNHPLEKWTNNQYYAFANLFSRVRAKGWGGDSRSGDGLRTLYVVQKGELIQPLTGKPQPPTPLDGEPIPFGATKDRRIQLANWLTSPDNPYFSRAITNRIWHNFFGVGLVEQVDDLRISNPASNDKLLTEAANYLSTKKYDLKELMRAILQSETYQRSSVPLSENKNDKRFYSRYYPKRLMAEVLLDGYSQVTDVPTVFTEIVFPGADRKKTDFYPKGTRAIQLYDSAVSSYFLKTFGRNQRRITCECERSNEPTMVQVLHVANGKTINEKLQTKQNRITRWMKDGFSDSQIIERAYLLGLSRYPTMGEKLALLEVMKESKDTDRRVVLEDLLWGVLSSREFLFNH